MRRVRGRTAVSKNHPWRRSLKITLKKSGKSRAIGHTVCGVQIV